jgi:hypothetical protein
MRNRGSSWVLLLVVIIFSLWGLLLLGIIAGRISYGVFFGIPIGFIVGIGTGKLFSRPSGSWGPPSAKEKKSERIYSGLIGFLLVVIGVLVRTNILDGMISDALMGAVLAWVSGFFFYAGLKWHEG